MSSLLKKLSISIKIHVVNRLCSVFKLSIESVISRRKLVANCVHTADATQLNSFVASASAVCIGHNTTTTSSNCYYTYMSSDKLDKAKCLFQGYSAVYSSFMALFHSCNINRQMCTHYILLCHVMRCLFAGA